MCLSGLVPAKLRARSPRSYRTQILRQVAGIELVSQVIRIGTVCAGPNRALPTPSDNEALNSSPVRNLDKALAQRLMAEIDATKRAGDTLGGEVEVLAYNVPVGLGSHVSAQRRLDARLAGALMSIQSVKGVQIGDASVLRAGSLSR